MLKIMLILLLLFIFLQDLKKRAVYWFLFPIVFGISFVIGRETNTYENMLYNAGFFLLNMVFLTLYVSAKHRKWTNITQGFFSWGDVYFLVAILPLFHFYDYVVFFTLGTLLTLFLHLLVTLLSRGKMVKTIPFAGYMSLFLVVYLSAEVQCNRLIHSCP